MKRIAVALAIGVAALAAPAALASGGLSGSYKTVLKTPLVVAGTWTVTFSHGTYTAKDDGQLVVKGKNTFNGSKVTFTDTGGPGRCKTTGKYTYSVSGTKLTFKKISDGSACVGRVAVLTSHALTKV